MEASHKKWDKISVAQTWACTTTARRSGYTMTTSLTAGALLMSMQKSWSPPVAVAVTFVSVCASAPGSIADNDKSTLTEVEPFLMGNDMALKVSDPTPSGKWQVFDWLASPLQETLPAKVFISRSKLAPDTSSSRFPVPVMVAV